MNAKLFTINFFGLLALCTLPLMAQIKIGNNPTTINPSALLELESTNKGLVPPRIALTGLTDIVTIPSPLAGTVIFNTTTSATLSPGLYYFAENSWQRVVNEKAANSGGNTKSQTTSYVGTYQGQLANGVTLGDYAFRVARRTGNTSYTTSNEVVDTQIKYVGALASQEISGFASTMWSNGQYDFSGTVMAAPSNTVGSPTQATSSTNRNNSILIKGDWYGLGNDGFETGSGNTLEKRQYNVTPADPTLRYFYRIEFMLIDSTSSCSACNAANPSENDAKVIILIEFIYANN